MDHEDDSAEIKVVDKRRFSMDGSSTEPSESQVEEKPTETAAEQDMKTTGDASGQERSPAAEFSGFIVSLATQALMLLGEIPNPETGQRSAHPEAARQIIDFLAVLDLKTKGNLTQEEETLLSEVLASVRLAYVNHASNED